MSKSVKRSPKNTCVFCGSKLNLSPQMNGYISVETDHKAIGYVCYPWCEVPPIELV